MCDDRAGGNVIAKVSTKNLIFNGSKIEWKSAENDNVFARVSSIWVLSLCFILLYHVFFIYVVSEFPLLSLSTNVCISFCILMYYH